MSPPIQRGGPTIPDRPTPQCPSRRQAAEQDHGNASRSVPTAAPPVVSGVVEFELADPPDWPTIPSEVSTVRATVGRTWADMAALDRLASAAWMARVSVEVVGTNGQVVADAVRFVRRRLDECQQADAEFEALQRRAVNG